METKIVEIESRIQALEVARSFFDTQLQSNLNVLILYVGLASLALSFLGLISWRYFFSISRKEIREILEGELSKVESKLENMALEREKKMVDVIADFTSTQRDELDTLRSQFEADTGRIYGSMYGERDGSEDMALLWRLRGAQYDTSLKGGLIDGAIESAVKMKAIYRSVDRREIVQLIAGLPDEYSVEKKILSDEVQRVVASKLVKP